MTAVKKIVTQMRENACAVSFRDLTRACDHSFGDARTRGGSHTVYTTPWPGGPRVNVPNDHGKAKAYQVRQVLAAIDTLEASR